MSKYIYLTSKIDEAGVYNPARPAAFTSSKMTLLNGIPEGYSENQRIGRKLNMKRLHLVVDSESPYTFSEQRFLIIYYKSPNGLPVSMSTFMANLADFTSRPMLNPFNEINKSSFEVLFDKIICVNPDDRSFFVDLDLKGLPVLYSGATEFQDHVQHGGLYTLSLVGNTGAAGSLPTHFLEFGGTLYYNDK